GSVDGSHYHDRAGRPCPESAIVNPASVMAGGKSPRRVVHPSPSPGLHPNPMTVVVRRPARRDRRDPNCAILARRAPDAVLIEIVSAHHVRGDILVRLGVVFAVVADTAPVVKTIETRRLAGLVLQRGAAGETRLLACAQFHAGALAVGFAFAVPHRDGGGVGVGIDVKTIVARFQD